LVCEEKARLLRQYDDSTLASSNAVPELFAGRSKGERKHAG